jgi:tRNA uridine 5-carbamoylmethylation protein Kti12
MLINFIGAPCSGKTTTAAMVFAEFKERGITCEFIVEQARFYIAEKRLKQKENFKLTTSDQYKMMSKQFKIEQCMVQASTGAIVISDSSPLNGLLYVKKFTKDILELVDKVNQNLGLTFYCPPVNPQLGLKDPNRVHTYEDSVIIDLSVKAIIDQFSPMTNLIELSGNTTARCSQVIGTVLGKYFESLVKNVIT